ncbi:hypothetical protein FB480_101365 [Agrobacterium vitis]|nr:hypothetical protein FB480_101365 [Agrobacterium vitis]
MSAMITHLVFESVMYDDVRAAFVYDTFGR